VFGRLEIMFQARGYFRIINAVNGCGIWTKGAEGRLGEGKKWDNSEWGRIKGKGSKTE
jgi:hypothetical protein